MIADILMVMVNTVVAVSKIVRIMQLYLQLWQLVTKSAIVVVLHTVIKVLVVMVLLMLSEMGGVINSELLSVVLNLPTEKTLGLRLNVPILISPSHLVITLKVKVLI